MNELQSRIVQLFPALRLLQAPAWIVGGAVRDLIRDVEPLDVDIALDSAREVAADFAERAGGRLVEMGRPPFASVRVAIDGRVYDFAPIQGASIEADLGRRDFTVNAIAFPLHADGILDPHNGRADIRRSVLRLVAARNLDDDPLRVMRGVRLAQNLELTVDQRSLEEMAARTSRVGEVAPERVTFELRLILEGPKRVQGLRLLHELGLDIVIFGREVGSDRIESVASVSSNDAVSVLAVLLADLSKSEIQDVNERWRWPGVWRDGVFQVRSFLRGLEQGTDLPILVHDFGLETARRAADWLQASGDREESDAIRRIVNEEGDEIAAIEELLDGREISDITGTPPGPRIGRIKRALLEAQIRGEVNSREEAFAFVRDSEARLRNG